MIESFFPAWAIFASVDVRLANHEDHKGHEDRTEEITSKPKKYFLLRGLRALRGAISLSPLGCGSVALGASWWHVFIR
jgi:hypothetical protein